MTKGIITYWITDIKKAKDAIDSFRDMVDKVNPIIKKPMLDDIDNIVRILNKGKVK